MRNPVVATICATMAITGATAASAQTAADKADARCILAISVAGRDPKNQASAEKGAFFYLGQMAARGVSARMGPILVAEAKTINSPALIQAELTRCGAELNARGAELGAGMQALQKAAETMRAAPPMAK